MARVPAATKAAVIALVARTKARSGWATGRTLRGLGVSRSVYYAWCRREDLTDGMGPPQKLYEVLPAERQAICAFALLHARVGYRKLTWMMVDAGTACVGESTVYRVLRDADLLTRWKRSSVSSGEYRYRPSAPNEQWHTDVMYVWIAGRFYFLLNFIDAWSRYAVHWKLLLELKGERVAIELELALAAVGEARPRIVHDHGSEFCNRDVAAVIKEHNLLEIKTKPRHPESNGIVERFNGTVRDESNDQYGANVLQAEQIVDQLMKQYNNTRLHATLGYMTPATWHLGEPEKIRTVRAEKIAAARAHRKSINQQRINRPPEQEKSPLLKQSVCAG